ncbi:MAG: hypothetical protein VX438_11505, partial [Planctomycetota bacterium]|nr:hypothetical protein [Planctomycetota bacterium]
GFKSFEVDQAINQSLEIQSMEQAARWMGYPFEAGYPANRARYLELEEIHTRVDVPPLGNFVLDTTGSIVYGSEELRRWIGETFLVVGMKVSPTLAEILIRDYFAQPKTVIWGDEFSVAADETGIEAIKRCFPVLMANRTKVYSEMADLEIDAEFVRNSTLTDTNLLGKIREKLPAYCD